MTCAKNIQIRWRQDRLHKNLQRTAADEASVILRILIQIKAQGARLLRFHHFARCLPHLGFHAAATNGSNNRAIVPHQHFCGLERRNRPSHVHDGRHCPAAPVFAQAHNLLVQVHSTDYGGQNREGQTLTERGSDKGLDLATTWKGALLGRNPAALLCSLG